MAKGPSSSGSGWRAATIFLGVLAGVLLLFGVVCVFLFVETRWHETALRNGSSCPVPGWEDLGPLTAPVVPDDDERDANAAGRSGSDGASFWRGRIPAVIYQTHARRDVPSRMAKATRTVRELNPDFRYEYFDDRESRTFLEETDFVSPEFDTRLRAAHATLGPAAFKSDLFRAALLFKRGGVYLDMGFVANRPLREVLRPDDRFVSARDNLRGCVYQAFLASEPGHPVLRQLLETIVTRVEGCQTGRGICKPLKLSTNLWLTGPQAAGDAFGEVVGRRPLESGDYGGGVRLLHKAWYYFPRCSSISGLFETAEDIGKPDRDRRAVFWTRYPGYYQDSKRYPHAGRMHYSEEAAPLARSSPK